MTNKTKNSQYFFLILTYFIIITLVLLTFRDVGIHIEEKFHRMNGLYWLNYISQIFNFDKLNLIKNTDSKTSAFLTFKKGVTSFAIFALFLIHVSQNTQDR